VAVPQIEVHDALDSTNAEARRRAEAGAAGPLWITALTQTAGRGRRGRSWETAKGNLAATLLFNTGLPAAEAAQVSFVAALAAADLADHYIGAGTAALKWPNDLMIDGRKAAGILVESGTRDDGTLWLAVGMGVNLAQAPDNLERPAIAFSERLTIPPPQPTVALGVLAESFEKWRDLWSASGFAPIAKAWSARAYGLGQACEARLPNQTHRGIAEGLDEDGALRLRLADGTVLRITAGDVFFGGT